MLNNLTNRNKDKITRDGFICAMNYTAIVEVLIWFVLKKYIGKV
jgi:hypothetical protein